MLNLLVVVLCLAVVSVCQAKEPPEKARAIYLCAANIEQITKANAFWSGKRHHFASSLKDLGLEKLRCPVSRRAYVYSPCGNAKSYKVYCSGHFHRIDGARKDHPRYSSELAGPELK
jgi:hypothetical protein